VSLLALPAFSASAASTLSLQVDVLAEWPNSDNDFFQNYLSDWSIKFGNVPDILPGKQSFWDRPGVLEDKALVEASLHTSRCQASFLAAFSQHRGDWLFALPIASCSLKIDYEAVRVAVGLRLGLDLCILHNCHCASPVDARGLHSFVCKRAPGRSARRHVLNDLVALLQLEFPSLKSQPDYSGRTGNDQMASHWSLGRAASHYVGTSRSLANWLSHMLTEHLTGQVQQQSWQPLAKRTNMLILALVISLSSLPLRH